MDALMVSGDKSAPKHSDNTIPKGGHIEAGAISSNARGGEIERHISAPTKLGVGASAPKTLSKPESGNKREKAINHGARKVPNVHAQIRPHRVRRKRVNMASDDRIPSAPRGKLRPRQLRVAAPRTRNWKIWRHKHIVGKCETRGRSEPVTRGKLRALLQERRK
ncbi:hypothetical protein N9L68_08950 [bacterium]|nr:hypothetical protein [bacterium]